MTGTKSALLFVGLASISTLSQDMPPSVSHVFSHGIIPVIEEVQKSENVAVTPPTPDAPRPHAASVLPTVVPSDLRPPLAPETPRVRSDDQSKIAATAWSYFESNEQAATGWFDSVKGYSFTTMWDLASGLAAVSCAEKLGLITEDKASELLGRALTTLNKLKLYGGELPNREYNTALGTMSGPHTPGKGTGWSALDLGRLLIWLKIVESWHPEHAALIKKTVATWRVARLTRNGEMFGTYAGDKREQLRQEGRLGYEQYSASGLQLWGMPVTRAKDYAETKAIEIDGVPLLADIRNLPHLTSEPFLLAAFEVGPIDARFTALTDGLYRVQQLRWSTTGVVTAASEDSMDREPWFTYNDVYYRDVPWQCRSHSGDASPKGCGFSTKAAFGWSSLYEDNYAHLLDTTARTLAANGGFHSGVYPNGKPNKAMNINTNAIILEAMLFRQRGKRAFLETTK